MKIEQQRMTLQYRNILLVIASVFAISMFIMLVWLVQQSKIQSSQWQRLILQEQQLAKKMVFKKIKHQQKLQPQQQNKTNTATKKKVGNLPKDAQKLLEKALDEARKLRKLAKSGAYAEAGLLIKGLKANIWQASDMLPKVKKDALRKLMGILDYTAAQLKLKKTGSTKPPIHVIKNILDGKNG
ncbi:MAG: hypothetical protein Q9M11_01405 [Mariprofundaceae bacterium]|nr:hypothetical protein [Mariprofundaceae bacterium]